ncbi:energy transducer TonB [Erythrobacter sp. W53]|uniref:energy transducer TonB n=1 Tax=Erythrobacter sp. W53 TaxID=3425947 RepID=UPI003D7677EE
MERALDHNLPRREDQIGLAVAIGLHACLVALFLLQPGGRAPIDRPERMTVNLAEEIGLEAASPTPVAESRAAVAPEITNDINPTPEADSLPEPVRAQDPPPVRDNSPRRRPNQQQPTPPQETERRGGSRVGDNFLEGAGGSTNTTETRIPASQIGASAKASLVQGIAREIKPHWTPPSGPEVDKIVTFLRWRLNPDGSLSGRPQVVRQTGVNATNRAQAARHGEQAVRAVQLAAPFDLPEQYYEAWKRVGPFSFDWKLAQ